VRVYVFLQCLQITSITPSFFCQDFVSQTRTTGANPSPSGVRSGAISYGRMLARPASTMSDASCARKSTMNLPIGWVLPNETDNRQTPVAPDRPQRRSVSVEFSPEPACVLVAHCLQVYYSDPHPPSATPPPVNPPPLRMRERVMERSPPPRLGGTAADRVAPRAAAVFDRVGTRRRLFRRMLRLGRAISSTPRHRLVMRRRIRAMSISARPRATSTS